MEKVTSNQSLNLLSIQLKGELNVDNAKSVSSKIVKESSKLSPGYTLLYDLAQVKIESGAKDILLTTLTLLMKYDVGRVISVKTSDKALTDIGFDESKSTVYHQIEADSYETAVSLI